jgi:nucleoside-diphosphate-sugar epimerase
VTVELIHSSQNDPETDILKPALAGTLSLLESAKKTASVKSVVLTSSSVLFPIASPDSELTRLPTASLPSRYSRIFRRKKRVLFSTSRAGT